MKTQVSGHQMDIGESLKTHVTDRLAQIAEKYFDNPIDSHAVFSKEAHGKVRADIHMHVNRGILVQGHADAGDAYAAFDGACDRIKKQLSKYKERLKDHHRRMQEAAAQDQMTMAQQYILSSDDDGEPPAFADDAQPAIIAEMPTNIETLTVSEAVMRLDLSNEPVVIFKNRSHDGLNVVYRRRDGNISWVDPLGLKRAAE